jgi:ankyrin repeat protein
MPSRKIPRKGTSQGAELDQQLLIKAALGDRGACRSLISRGADVSATDAELATPLHAACRAGHAAVARLLLRRGADPEAQASCQISQYFMAKYPFQK